MRQSMDALVLDCSVEPLDVSIVIWFSHSGVAMCDVFFSEFLGKPGAKLWPVVGLYCLKLKRSQLVAS